MATESRSLHAGRVLSLHDALGRVIRCLSGAVWVTQEGDGRDRVLIQRDEMRIEASGKVAIQALRHAEIALL